MGLSASSCWRDLTQDRVAETAKNEDSDDAFRCDLCQGLSLGEGSSGKDWRNIFTECHEAREIILGHIDLESALACRLVCQDWRETVNCFKKLWTKINEVFSLAAFNFCTHDPIHSVKNRYIC